MQVKKVKVLVCDDSLLFRETLSRMLNQNPLIEVVGTAADVFEARDKIIQLKPNVLTLDIEMPKMNGIEFLKRLIPQHPLPVVVITSSPINAFEAISAGAVDFVNKPLIKSPADMLNFSQSIAKRIVIAQTAKVFTFDIKQRDEQKILSRPSTILDTKKTEDRVFALGASTGGTDALLSVVKNFPENAPGTLIVQHMPAGFTRMYAERLDKHCKMRVKEAEDGDRLHPGLIIVGGGGYHLRLHKDAQGYYVTSRQGEKVSGHCPSVDVMFDSVAKAAGDKAVGAILTGMGADGANGLLAMRKAGAFTIGQDKDSCVVYGMPMVAHQRGAVMKQAPLDQISQLMLDALNK